MLRWKLLGRLAACTIVVVILAGCGKKGGSHTQLTLAPPSMLPAAVRAAPPVVQEAYRFALANSELLGAIPCYCGCGSMGHTSNLSCYVQEFRADGSVAFDNHGFGCGICVDITRDVMRMLEDGKSLRQMQDRTHARYGRYGPGTTRFRLQ